MKTVQAWACIKDKMVPANFLSKTSRHCCSSKMRLARSNSTWGIHHSSELCPHLWSMRAVGNTHPHPPDCVCFQAATSRRAEHCAGRCPKRPDRLRSPVREKRNNIWAPCAKNSKGAITGNKTWLSSGKKIHQWRRSRGRWQMIRWKTVDRKKMDGGKGRQFCKQCILFDKGSVQLRLCFCIQIQGNLSKHYSKATFLASDIFYVSELGSKCGSQWVSRWPLHTFSSWSVKAPSSPHFLLIAWATPTTCDGQNGGITGTQ